MPDAKDCQAEDAEARTARAQDDGVPDAVRAAWAACETDWDDRARHDALLAQVAHYSCYAWAAARYKSRGADDAVAASQLERLRKAATATMLATATVRKASGAAPFQGTLIVVAILAILAGVGIVYIELHAPRSHATAP